MNRHSILFKINIIFFIGLLTALSVIGVVLFVQQKESHFRIEREFMQLFDALQNVNATASNETLRSLAERYGFSLLSKTEEALIVKHATEVENRPPPPNSSEQTPQSRPKFHKPFQVYLFDGDYYFSSTNTQRMFKLLSTPSDPFIPILGILGVLPVLMVFMYLATRNSLKPMGSLHKAIKAFGEGRTLQLTKNSRQDEIALISNAFYESAKKIQYLSESRKLFLRNIMHEFNTPIAKGRIIAEMSQDNNKAILENIFNRLELLVKELSDTEKVTSGNISCNIKEYRIIDIIDHAGDQLYIDEEIHTDISNQTIHCDYPMMSLVFKNLIDNANKYGKELFITSGDTTLSFISSGDKLSHPLNFYTEPFTQENYTDTTNKGLGLGLYIVNEVLKKQNFSLSYEYKEGKNCFIINL